ncbi:MAG TPA: alpha/beta fold hydrolase, partial [Actinomycetota bacterium]|nr:alpha/beta fold hydrolase [Actinomycetota bacterium]
MTSALTIRSTDGLALEAQLDGEGTGATVVLCHPHPQMGGTMNAPLLLALRDSLVAQGRRVLRFNFRGIGGSEGTSGTGDDEVNDARGAIEAARDLGEGPIVVAGWSFGAAVAIRVAATEDVAACVAIAPPIASKEGVTAGTAGAVPQAPTLVVVGANDRQVSPAECRDWAER